MHKSGTKKKRQGSLGRFIRRTLLVLFTLVLLTAGGLAWVLNTVLTGPSETARDALVLTLLDNSATDWIPEWFLDPELIRQIPEKTGIPMEETITDPSLISATSNGQLTYSGEWKGNEAGIRMEEYTGTTYKAHILIIRDPSRVVRTASEGTAGEQLASSGALAAIGCSGSAGEGFVGFTEENVLVVCPCADDQQVQNLNLRVSCQAGPALIVNGQANSEIFSITSGYAPRSAIGQRADGAVIFLSIDGWRPDSLGATYHDMIDLLAELGAVNACCLSSGFTELAWLDAASGKAVTLSGKPLLADEIGSSGFWLAASQEQEG